MIDITNEDSDKQSPISPAANQPNKKTVSSNSTCNDTTEVDEPRTVKNLEDLVVAYLTLEYPGMDPYQVCNEHFIKESMQNQLLTLNQLCTNELSKRLSSQEIDKLIVQADKSDKRNTDMEKFLHVLELKKENRYCHTLIGQ